jgi:hypothetical protein
MHKEGRRPSAFEKEILMFGVRKVGKGQHKT